MKMTLSLAPRVKERVFIKYVELMVLASILRFFRSEESPTFSSPLGVFTSLRIPRFSFFQVQSVCAAVS